MKLAVMFQMQCKQSVITTFSNLRASVTFCFIYTDVPFFIPKLNFKIFQIEDLAGGETDRFCGELAPFMWESRGSRVRLAYSQVDDDSGLSAVYSLQNI